MGTVMNALGLIVLTGLLAGAKPSADAITWPEMAKLDYRSGKLPRALKKKLQKRVRIKGYVIPLEGDGKGVTSLLLVSDPMYCGHVPPPPPNQLLLVEFKKPKSWDLFRAGYVWMTGRMDVVNQRSSFGGYMYQMKKIAKIEKGKDGLESLFR